MLWKKILGKSTGKVGNLDVKNTTVAPSVLEKNVLNNNIFFVYCNVAICYDCCSFSC